MKPCPLCRAAVPDDVMYSPENLFCGACGRNAAQVSLTPSLPPGAPLYSVPPSAAAPDPNQPPWVGVTTGQGTVSPPGTAPPGLNWGAFLLPFLWGPANKVPLGLLALIGFIPLGITQIVSLGVSVYLLIQGNELSWRGGRVWQSVPEFQAVQKSWMIWGLAAAGASVALGMIFYGVMLSAGGGQYAPQQ